MIAAVAGRLRRDWATLAACLAGACVLSVLLRQDSNWDLLSYHLYDPYAALAGRLSLDLMPAGIQTYLNPLLDLPYYLLAVRLLPHWPRLVAALAGIPFGLLVFLVWRLSRAVLAGVGVASRADAALAAAIGLSGTTVYAEIGTTFGDIPIAVLVVAALLPLTRAAASGAVPAALAAGVLLGAAAGLKLTALPYAPAAVAGLAACGGGWRRTAAVCGALCAGWLLGAIACLGWWGWIIGERFGNPVFPLLNSVFGSPWAGPVSGQDVRFIPQNLPRAVLLPLRLPIGGPWLVSEINFRDARLLAALLAIAVLVLRRRPPASPPARVLLTFFVVAFALWEGLFSIIRYAVPLEAICGIPIGVALCGARRPRLLLAAALLLLVASANYAGWGRLRHYETAVFDIAPVPLDPGAVVVLANKPLAYLAPFLPAEGVSFVGITDMTPGNLMWDAAVARIAHAASLYVVVNLAPDTFAARLRPFGVTIDEPTCRPIPNSFQGGVALCRGKTSR